MSSKLKWRWENMVGDALPKTVQWTTTIVSYENAVSWVNRKKEQNSVHKFANVRSKQMYIKQQQRKRLLVFTRTRHIYSAIVFRITHTALSLSSVFFRSLKPNTSTEELYCFPLIISSLKGINKNQLLSRYNIYSWEFSSKWAKTWALLKSSVTVFWNYIFSFCIAVS